MKSVKNHSKLQSSTVVDVNFRFNCLRRRNNCLPIAKSVHGAFGSFAIRHIIEQPGSSIKRRLTPADAGLFAAVQAKRCVAVESAGALVVDHKFAS